MASGRKGGRRSRRSPMAEINVTPFVDVMLVLLIVFMVTAPLLTAGVPVELPDSRANALPQEQQEITVTLANDGIVYLDKNPLGAGELAEQLAVIASREAGELPNVTLRADRGLPYGNVMGVMGELNRAGFNSISLVTNTAAGPPAAAPATAPAAVPDTAPDTTTPEAPSAAMVSDGSEIEP